jgi:hypothetical protein
MMVWSRSAQAAGCSSIDDRLTRLSTLTPVLGTVPADAHLNDPKGVYGMTRRSFQVGIFMVSSALMPPIFGPCSSAVTSYPVMITG